MAKLKHISLPNLIHLTGLADQAATRLAKVLDGLTGEMMKRPELEAQQFRDWCRRASFENPMGCDWNFSFRAYQFAQANGKPITLTSIDATQTPGGDGYVKGLRQRERNRAKEQTRLLVSHREIHAQ